MTNSIQNKEIGSEFWNVPTQKENNKIFDEKVQWYISGRSALQAIIKDIEHAHNCVSIAMPSWCCDSMIKPFVDADIEVKFYPVYWNSKLIQEIRMDCNILLIMDYFGYTSDKPDLSNYNGLIIRDVTHSIFSTDYTDSDYYFGSLRKWCGIWTGGYAYTQDGRTFIVEDKKNDEYVFLRKKAMEQKNDFIKLGAHSDKGYLSIFSEAEELLENIEVVPAAERDIELAQYLDVEEIRKSRRRNTEILRKAFPEWLIFKDLKESDCPLFVPILVPDNKRDELRKHLINKEIYCPVHWPASKYHCLDERTEFIYKNELSLVCDQRYNENDMNRIIDTINDFWKGF